MTNANATPKTFTRWNHEGLVIFSDYMEAREFHVATGSLPDGPYLQFVRILIDDVTFYALPVADLNEAVAMHAYWDAEDARDRHNVAA